MFTSFQNPGLIEVAAITTLGINVKETDNPIGFFGTGLKYAIASLLRNSHKITIYRGLDRLDFNLVSDEVRGKMFQFIEMSTNGETPLRLGFTADLGKQWEMWQVFRELYSNCLDEGGGLVQAKLDPAEDLTTIQVWGNAFAEAAADRDSIFLKLSLNEDLSTNEVEVHEGVSRYIFYRGVRVAALPKPSLYTYNLKYAALTEDRTLVNLSHAEYPIECAIAKIENDYTLEKFLTDKDTFEANLTYFGESEAFYERVMSIIQWRGETAISPNLRQLAKASLKTKITYTPVRLTQTETSQIDAACFFLEAMGFDVVQKINVIPNLGPGIAGLARDGEIFISQETLTKGGNFLIGTILEEHIYIVHGFSDQSRELQNFLLDLLIKFAKEARG